MFRLGVLIDEAEIAAFFGEMRAREFDLAIQMHGGGTDSNPFVSLLGARQSLGLTGRDAPTLDSNLRYVFYQHEVLRYLEPFRDVVVVHRPRGQHEGWRATSLVEHIAHLLFLRCHR